MLFRIVHLCATGILFGLTLDPVASQTYNQSKDLLSQLLSGYDKDVRPLHNQSLTLNVGMSMDIRSLESVNEMDQTIAVRTYLRFNWKDELLTWQPQDYGNIEIINPGLDKAWLPPFNLAGQISENQALVDTSLVTPLRVVYDGTVTWFPNVRLIQTCNLDMTYFPNDEHNCTFEVYVLMYSTKQVLVQLNDLKPGLGTFVENGEWRLLSTSWVSLTYGVSNETFQVINMSLRIKRRPRFFLMNLLFPTLALSFLNILVFVLPADSGEKVGYSITVLLSVMFMMSVTTDSMPASSQLPLITQFMAVLVAISVFSVVATVISLFVHHKIDREKKEETKALSILHNWKSKLGKKLVKPLSPKQVHPSQSDSHRGGQESKTDIGTKELLRPTSVVPSKTYLNTSSVDAGVTQGPTPDVKSSVICDIDKEYRLNSAKGGFTESTYTSPRETATKGSGIGGLASLWYRGRRGVNSDLTPRSEKDPLKTDIKPKSKKNGDDFLTLVQVYLDLILFWLFLVTWIAVTVGFSVAIFK